MINRSQFFTKTKSTGLYTKLNDGNVQGMEAIMNEWESKPTLYMDQRWLAYMLATAYHETARTMQPIEEYLKGKFRNYGHKIKQSGKAYMMPDKLFYGRGLVQLTWYENYFRMGQILKIDLLNNPEKALEMDVAVRIMFEGMTKGESSFGDFTGRCLEQYFNPTTNLPIKARAIINSTDKAELIAGYHDKFLIALN